MVFVVVLTNENCETSFSVTRPPFLAFINCEEVAFSCSALFYRRAADPLSRLN